MDAVDLTEEQRRVIDAVVHSVETAATAVTPPEHVVLEAVAGSGKSSTLVALVQRLCAVRPGARILLLQFNQDACARMRRRLSHGADVHTIHAFALRLVGAECQVDPRKMYHAWAALRPAYVAEGGSRVLAEWFRVQRFVDDARHRAWFPDFDAVRPLSLEMAVLETMLRDRDVLDQEDAVYHALYYGFSAPAYDAILVDEAQDLNRANLLFVRRCMAPHTVLCAVGDPAQSIYAFRGAMPDSMQRLKDAFNASVWRLTGCFRCPRRVVEIASHLNPHIHAAPNATDGRVALSTTLAPWAHVLSRARDGGVLFLARCNRALAVRGCADHPNTPGRRRSTFLRICTSTATRSPRAACAGSRPSSLPTSTTCGRRTPPPCASYTPARWTPRTPRAAPSTRSSSASSRRPSGWRGRTAARKRPRS